MAEATSIEATRFVDLTHVLSTGLQIYPGDPEVLIEPAATLEHDGVALTQLHLGSHSGTHMDAPSHTVAGGRTIDHVAIEETVGRARVIALPHLADDDVITVEDLTSATAGDPLPRIVFLSTGWDRYFGSQRYLQHPVLDPAAAWMLWERGVRVFGFDWLNPDPTLLPSGEPAHGLPVHDIILGNDGLIVENLTNLTHLPTDRDIDVSVLPMRIAGADGSPVRAIARI